MPGLSKSATTAANGSVSTAAATTAKRTLILCPPAVSSQPHVLENALATADRAATDVQMLDRLALNLATLPEGIYSSVLLLSDPSSSSSTSTSAPPSFSSTTLDGLLLQKVFTSMAPGGRWRSQCGDQEWARDRLLFLTAGFLIEEASPSPAEGVVVTALKPDFGGQKTVALSFRNRPRPAAADGGAAAVVKPVVLAPLVPPTLVGPAAYDLGDDLDDVGDGDGDDDGDDELIDEDELMANDDLATPVQMRMRSAVPLPSEERACDG